MSSLVPGTHAGAVLDKQLLADDRAIRVGGIHHLDFNRAVVLTHDRWKADAGGIPQFCFLLATARDVAGEGGPFDDDEVLLLRVEDTAPLSQESELLAVREEALREGLSRQGSIPPSEVIDLADELDPYTKNRVSFTGLDCRILGTFYEDAPGGDVQLVWGHDIDNFYATRAYQVFKPVGDGLSLIASYLKPSDGPVRRTRIGEVRYSSTRRRAQAADYAAAPVEVNIHDFIGHKTALLGMTRTGKSNTAKILIARTFAVSEHLRGEEDERPIGQLIFDPQGEYANPNTQDGTEIAAIGPRHVRIFAFGADADEKHVRPLGINFFDPNQIGTVQGLISDKLRSEGASGYVRDFAATDFSDVEGDWGQITRASRGRLLLYGSLMKAGFQVPEVQVDSDTDHEFDYSIRFSIASDLRGKVTAELGTNPFRQAGSGGWYATAPGDARNVIDAIISLKEGGDDDAFRFCNDIRWASTEPIYTGQSTGGGSVRGWRNLIDLRDFHNPDTRNDPADDIYSELLDGRIVIVDLHLGPGPIIKALSEQIVTKLLRYQTDAFTSGQVPPSIQVMLEEAHNLFGQDRFKEDGDVWVRLAKEASKLNLGMTYATQEVSSVAHNVKTNTANWVVAHLNNTVEVRELSKFYDFAAYEDAIVASEDRGYVRLKTLSSPYIAPVQIDRYHRELVNDARAAAGDPPLAANEDDSAPQE